MSLLDKISKEEGVLSSIIEDVLLFQASNSGFSQQDLKQMNEAATKVFQSNKLDLNDKKIAAALLLSLHTHLITGTLNNIDAIIADTNFALSVTDGK